jgi:hypothetical protein
VLPQSSCPGCVFARVARGSSANVPRNFGPGFGTSRPHHLRPRIGGRMRHHLVIRARLADVTFARICRNDSAVTWSANAGLRLHQNQSCLKSRSCGHFSPRAQPTGNARDAHADTARDGRQRMMRRRNCHPTSRCTLTAARSSGPALKHLAPSGLRPLRSRHMEARGQVSGHGVRPTKSVDREPAATKRALVGRPAASPRHARRKRAERSPRQMRTKYAGKAAARSSPFVCASKS